MKNKEHRISYRLLDEVCLDCCDNFKNLECDNCGVRRLKLQYRAKQIIKVTKIIKENL